MALIQLEIRKFSKPALFRGELECLLQTILVTWHGILVLIKKVVYLMFY
jgi:hypothetical protein